MTLREVLKNYEGQWCYIGAATSFLWIGKVEGDYEADIDKYSKWEYNNMARLIDRSANEVQRYKKDLDVTTNAEEMEFLINKIENGIAYLKKRTPYFANWTPFLDREVTEVYDRTVVEPLGKIISIVGTEDGNCWDIEEFNKKKERMFGHE